MYLHLKFLFLVPLELPYLHRFKTRNTIVTYLQDIVGWWNRNNNIDSFDISNSVVYDV